MSAAVPTSGEFRAFLRQHGLSGSKAAALAGLKSSRSIRKMCADESSRYHKPVPAAVWFMLREKVAKGEHLLNGSLLQRK